MLRRQPILVLRKGTKRDVGRKAQSANIAASKAVADIVRTTMGPCAMLKMLLNPMGQIVITNDGNAILREIDVAHPAAKSIIELSRAQREEVGDGTTSVVVLTGEILATAEALLNSNTHPTILIAGLMQALEDSLEILKNIAQPIPDDVESICKVVASCLQSKCIDRWYHIIPKIAVEAARMVTIERSSGNKEIDVKRYAQILKIPGGEIEDSMVLSGVMLNKDVTHAKMKRYIENPRIVLLDCPLEYKKAESATNVEVTKEEDWKKLLMQEELEMKKMAESIIATGCNVCITEKGVSDLAQHFLLKAGISVIRRIRKTDNNRLARVTGATICNRTDELTQKDVGTEAGLFEIRTIGNEYYTYITQSKNPHACTIVVRGPSKEVIADVERTISAALLIARNVLLQPFSIPGGGACETELATRLTAMSDRVIPARKAAYCCLPQALRVIPRTLLVNSGANVLKRMTELEALHQKPGGINFGVDGNTGEIVDTIQASIIDTMLVKTQMLKTAVEAAAMILRIDDILSGISRKNSKTDGAKQENPEPETFGDMRDG